MTKIQIELPEATAKAAREAGILTPQALGRLLTDAIRRQQAADLLVRLPTGRRSRRRADVDAKTSTRR